MTEESDEILVLRSRDGDRHAFECLIVRYQKPVFNVARRMLRDPDEAQDVAQNVFLKVYEHLGSYDARHRVYSWIYRIAVNESINALNRGRRFGPLEEEQMDQAAGPEQQLHNAQSSHRLQLALMQLKLEYRTVIVMKHMLGCSYQDIGTMLDLPEKTVKSRLFSARQLLKELLQDSGC